MPVKPWASVALAVLLLAQLCASEANEGARKVDVIKSQLFFGFNYTRLPPARPPLPSSSRITVGGSEHWRFGFNYTDWAFRTSPFHKNDTLVFMYDPPSNGTFPHSVYLLRDYRSFLTCDLRKAKMVGSVTRGGGVGFEFVLRRTRPHYFACGERDGFHCRVGMMKFPVFPVPFKRSWHP